MKYIIMCGGPRSYKPLWTVYHEQLVARTVRLLREYGVKDIAISSNDERYYDFDVPVLRHENSDTWENFEWLNAFYPAKEPVCYLMGDVFYSPYAIRTIVGTETTDIEFFASAPPFNQRWYIKNHAEPFAFKVQDWKHFEQCVKQTIEYRNKFIRKPPITWELWQVIKETPLNMILYNNYTAINDYTTDVDDENEIRELERVLRSIP